MKGVANPNSVYTIPSRFVPTLPTILDPVGPDILIVPGPTYTSFHVEPVIPNEKVLVIVGIIFPETRIWVESGIVRILFYISYLY